MSTPTLAGAIGAFSPIHLLRLIQDARFTGRIELVRGSEQVDLFVEHGRSVFARSTGATLHVGEILVRQGDLRPEAIELALAVQSDMPGQRLGRMLVESGSVTEAQVRNAVLAVQRQILCDVLLWQHGDFRLIVGEPVPEEDVRLDLDVDRLVVGLLALAGDALEQQKERDAA
jgi:uncharacterized protein DUF4388